MNKELIVKRLFWIIILVLVCVCSYFIMHNAAWLLGDDCQSIIYTGWDKPIFGFFVDPSLGRFFPLDYTIYDILCLFYDGRIPPSAHYFMHVLGFILFVGSFIAISFYILKDAKYWYKYTITLFVIVLAVGRSYALFVECWTGIWTIFAFLALFLLCHVKFINTKKWIWAIVGLLGLNYILYYYETMFVIPLSLGVCALAFSYKRMDKNDKIYNGLLVASGLIFLLLYAVLVLPKVEHFYSHHIDVSPLMNAAKMFYAQKIMWVALVFLLYRIYLFVKKRAEFNLYDNLLLASCAYCCGAAFLGLNYVLYYIPGVLVAIPAILYFSNEYLKNTGTIILFACLAIFYGRLIPKAIANNQKNRVSTYNNIQLFIEEIGDNNVYFYELENPELEEWEMDVRSIHRFYLETVTGWYMNDKGFSIERKIVFNGEPGLWQVVKADQESFVRLFPSAEELVDFGEYKVYRVSHEPSHIILEDTTTVSLKER